MNIADYNITFYANKYCTRNLLVNGQYVKFDDYDCQDDDYRRQEAMNWALYHTDHNSQDAHLLLGQMPSERNKTIPLSQVIGSLKLDSFFSWDAQIVPMTHREQSEAVVRLYEMEDILDEQISRL